MQNKCKKLGNWSEIDREISRNDNVSETEADENHFKLEDENHKLHGMN